MSIGKLGTTGFAAVQIRVRTCLIVLAPYAVLGQGKFKTPEELKAKGTRGGGAPPTDEQIQLCKVLQEVAEEIGGGIKLANGAWRLVSSIQSIPLRDAVLLGSQVQMTLIFRFRNACCIHPICLPPLRFSEL
jgi:hypothetical protein